MNKETSSRVSSLASTYARITGEKLIAMVRDDAEGTANDIQSIAGSALSQDETPGQNDDKPARKFPPEITITDDGPNTIINVDYGPNTYHAYFSTGDDKARDAAITSLTEKICGFSSSTILIALHNAENERNNDDQ